MRQLTIEEAKWCARVCKWVSSEKRDRYDGLLYTLYRDKDGYYYDELPLDPLFWIGRLWVRLEMLYPNCSLVADSERKWYEVHYGYENEGCGDYRDLWVHSDHPCLALCEANEKLKEESNAQKA